MCSPPNQFMSPVEIDSKHFLNDSNNVITSCPKYTITVSIYVFNKFNKNNFPIVHFSQYDNDLTCIAELCLYHYQQSYDDY